MHYIKISILVILSSLYLPSNAEDLAETIYRSRFANTPSSEATSFVILAHIALNEKIILEIINDYKNEKNGKRKFYYEYLLSMRTMENTYTDRFIESAQVFHEDLINNNTDWISIESPFYKHIALYASTNEKALELLLSLIPESDGAISESLAIDLIQIKKSNPDHFWKSVKHAGLSAIDITNFTGGE